MFNQTTLFLNFSLPDVLCFPVLFLAVIFFTVWCFTLHIYRDLRLFVARKEHIRSFAEMGSTASIGGGGGGGGGIPPPSAHALIDLLDTVRDWDPVTVPGCREKILEGRASTTAVLGAEVGGDGEPSRKASVRGGTSGGGSSSDSSSDSYSAGEEGGRVAGRSTAGGRTVGGQERLQAAMKLMMNTPSFSPTPMPGSVLRQKAILDGLLQELQQHPVSLVGPGEGTLVIKALTYAAKQKDPMAFVNKLIAGDPATEGEDQAAEGDVRGDPLAWRMFLNVHALLQTFKALNGTEATQLGQLVGSLSAENELWLALVLSHPVMQEVTEAELAALLCGLLLDGYKATNAFFQQKPSERVVVSRSLSLDNFKALIVHFNYQLSHLYCSPPSFLPSLLPSLLPSYTIPLTRRRLTPSHCAYLLYENICFLRQSLLHPGLVRCTDSSGRNA